MEILFPLQMYTDPSDLQKINGIAKQPTFIPFDPLLLEFVQTVSHKLLSSTQIRPYPELVALAFWLRKSHIHKIMQDYHHYYRHSVPLARGVVFHIAPANVNSIFMYSWFLALLTGNSNIVRLSQRRDHEMELLLDILNEIVHQQRFQPIGLRNLVVSYAHEQEHNSLFSENCQVRVIWGGDETIKQIRSIPLPPNAIEIPFANKFSMATIVASNVVGASIAETKHLATQFFNDAFWFYQNACSSPRLIVWIGNTSDIEIAKNMFWEQVKIVILEKGLHWDVSIRINRMANGYCLAAKGLIDHMSSELAELPYRVHIKSISPELREQHDGGGLFFETEMTNIQELLSSVTHKDQTLAVYGFSQQEILAAVSSLHSTGLNRIVPIGRALDFDITWDGINLLTAFSRELTITDL